MELLTKLKQTHAIAAYKSQFKSTSNMVRDLSDMHKLSCFKSGMKDEIRLTVKMQGSRNLGEPMPMPWPRYKRSTWQL